MKHIHFARIVTLQNDFIKKQKAQVYRQIQTEAVNINILLAKLDVSPLITDYLVGNSHEVYITIQTLEKQNICFYAKVIVM